MNIDSSWIKAAHTDEIQPGEGFECDIEIDGETIGIFNIEGKFYALGECSHEQGPLGQGRIEEDGVVCPWHSAKFDIKTGKCTTPPSACRTNGTISDETDVNKENNSMPCHTFAVKIVDSHIYIKKN